MTDTSGVLAPSYNSTPAYMPYSTQFNARFADPALANR